MATIYIAMDADGDPLYVGQTTKSMLRLNQHYSEAPWWREASSAEAADTRRDPDELWYV